MNRPPPDVPLQAAAPSRDFTSRRPQRGSAPPEPRATVDFVIIAWVVFILSTAVLRTAPAK